MKVTLDAWVATTQNSLRYNRSNRGLQYAKRICAADAPYSLHLQAIASCHDWHVCYKARAHFSTFTLGTAIADTTPHALLLQLLLLTMADLIKGSPEYLAQTNDPGLDERVSIAFVVIDTFFLLIFYVSRYYNPKAVGLPMLVCNTLCYVLCIGSAAAGICKSPLYFFSCWTVN